MGTTSAMAETFLSGTAYYRSADNTVSFVALARFRNTHTNNLLNRKQLYARNRAH